MSTPGSVSEWIALLKEGDQVAAQMLWGRYFHQLVDLAHRQLKAAAGASSCGGPDAGRRTHGDSGPYGTG
jgi:hypothetical protein